jgi:hypothetical protein
MAITSLDDLIAAHPGQFSPFLQVFTVGSGSTFTSLWAATGFPGPGATPSPGLAGEVPTDATIGSFKFVNPTSPDLSYLGRMSATATLPGYLILYDRLWQNSGLSPTSTSAQTINSVALTRQDANGEDVEAWLQMYTAMGAGTPTLTISYTNQDGTSGRSGSFVAATTMPALRTHPFSLQAGDTGVRSIQTYTQSATMTSGTHGLVMRRRIASLGIGGGGGGGMFDPVAGGLPRIYDDACIEMMGTFITAGATTVFGEFAILQG